jgi:hypothetical protein
VARPNSDEPDFSYEEISYGKTKNPLYLWSAYLESRQHRVPAPDWVLDYFDRVGRRFMQMWHQAPRRPYTGPERRKKPTRIRSNDRGPERRRDAFRDVYDKDDPIWFSRPKKGETAREVYRALEFKRTSKGPSNPFSDNARSIHEFMLAFAVYDEHTRLWHRHREGKGPLHDWDTIFKDVADKHNRKNPPCEVCKKVSKASVKAFWYKHALTVIPPHLVRAAKSKRIDDILR